MPSSSPRRFLRGAFAPVVLFISSALLFSAEAPEKKNPEDETLILSCFTVSTGTLGATPGGAKDIRFFRSGAARGEIPHPDTFTPEGLFSEHDLPLDLGAGGNQLFRVQSAATDAQFEGLPSARYLAQLGLDSGIDAAAWKPAPLNLVAVVDKSGSMNGEPLALVRASLKSALRHLRNGDQLSIVLYGDRSHVHLAPTVVSRASRSKIIALIDAIESAGSTNMEAGLKVGYDVARETRAHFTGNTRVMLFTDERPNVGNTHAEGFMAMATAASGEGIGLTTIGVGVQFGAELAARISGVRGGNLFFFSSGDEMKKTFKDEFDTLVTELAHDFSIRIEPALGFRIEGVYGVPSNLLRWDGSAIVMDVATIFLSRRKGAIYFALAPEKAGGNLPAAPVLVGDRLADVKFSYRNAADQAVVAGTAPCHLIKPTGETAGLSRGVALVDEYLTLQHAAEAHHRANDQETAFRLMSGLDRRFAAIRDRELDGERKLIRDLHNSLALLSGHSGEIQPIAGNSQRAALVGVWRKIDPSEQTEAPEFFVVWPNGLVEGIEVTPDKKAIGQRESFTLKHALPSGNRGKLEMSGEGDEVHLGFHFEIVGDTLKLTESHGARPGVASYTRAEFSEIPKPRPNGDELSAIGSDPAQIGNRR